MRILALAILALAFPVRAEQEQARKFEVAAALGYAVPIGSAEQGSRMTDMTLGAVPLELTTSYELSERFAVGLWGWYAAVVPKLCSGGADCTSSIGRDVALGARVQVLLPRIHAATPYAAAGIGYEWFTSKFVDSHVTSSRAYNGPVLLATEVGAPFGLGKGWSLGPALSVAVGTYVHSGLDTPAFSDGQNVPNRSFHAWASLSARLAGSF